MHDTTVHVIINFEMILLLSNSYQTQTCIDKYALESHDWFLKLTPYFDHSNSFFQTYM